MTWDEDKRVFLVWDLDRCEDRDSADKVMAANPRDAAERWAEHDDIYSAEYRIVGGVDVSVMVAEDVDGSEAIEFLVSGEAVPYYRARPIIKGEQA